MERFTKFIGYIFFGGWAIFGTACYIKAVIEFIVN